VDNLAFFLIVVCLCEKTRFFCVNHTPPSKKTPIKTDYFNDTHKVCGYLFTAAVNSFFGKKYPKQVLKGVTLCGKLHFHRFFVFLNALFSHFSIHFLVFVFLLVAALSSYSSYRTRPHNFIA
jgi:hypothetical protein